MDHEPYEVSARFGQMIVARILELELGAARDERIIPSLLSEDHRNRQRKLVDKQLEEAVRMRTFLGQARVREPRLPHQA